MKWSWNKRHFAFHPSSRKKKWQKKVCLHFDTTERCTSQFWIKFKFSQHIILVYKTEKKLVKGTPPLRKVSFSKKNGNWVFTIGRCAEDSSFRIYMVFWKTIRFWQTYEGNMRATTMFFEKFSRFFEIFQFLKD
jgi:hypothetical protein